MGTTLLEVVFTLLRGTFCAYSFLVLRKQNASLCVQFFHLKFLEVLYSQDLKLHHSPIMRYVSPK